MEKFSDPAKLQTATNEELVQLYAQTSQIIEDLEAQSKAIKDELAPRIKANGVVICDYSVVKSKRISWQITLEKAKELGAVKEAINNEILKKLMSKGVEIPHTVTNYLLIRPVKHDDN